MPVDLAAAMAADAPKPAQRRAILAALQEDPVSTWAAYRQARGAEPGPWLALHQAPQACPWFRPVPPAPAGVIDEVFEPIADDARGLIAALKRQCAALLTAEIDGRWLLLYLVQRGGKKGAPWRLEAWAGGAPDLEPALPEAIAEKWTIPDGLAALYEVHDGLAPWEGGWRPGGLWPADRVEMLPAQVGWTDYTRTKILYYEAAFLACVRERSGDAVGFYQQYGDPYTRAFLWSADRPMPKQTSHGIPALTSALVRSLRG